jgi:hypothetical protein
MENYQNLVSQAIPKQPCVDVQNTWSSHCDSRSSWQFPCENPVYFIYLNWALYYLKIIFKQIFKPFGVTLASF